VPYLNSKRKNYTQRSFEHWLHVDKWSPELMGIEDVKEGTGGIFGV